MSLWQKISQRIRRRLLLPGEKWGDKKHGECVNFEDGTCLIIPRAFKGRIFNPKGPACPHFQSKRSKENSKLL